MSEERFDIPDWISNIQRQVIEAKEQFIIDFFGGDREYALEHLHEYVLEEDDPVWKVNHVNFDTDSYKLAYNWRIRRKTEEELAADSQE